MSSVPGRETWSDWIEEAVLGRSSPRQLKTRSHQSLLRADVRAQVLPFRVLRIGGRPDRIGSDVTERARHADAVRTDETCDRSSRSDRCRSARNSTSCARSRRSPDSGTAAGRRCRSARRSTSRPERSFPRAPILMPGYLLASANGSGGQSPRSRTSSQSPKRFGSGPVGFLEARLVDESEIAPAVVASAYAVCAASVGRMRRDGLQQIERPEARRPSGDPSSRSSPPVQTIHMLRPSISRCDNVGRGTLSSMSWK